jgi:pimeloyl-ACP methyl ester carboxylesterase
LVRRSILVAASATLLLLIVRAAPSPPPSSSVVGSMGRGPTVVLVHGLGSDANDWLRTARDLARDHRVVLVGLPGHGITPMATPFSLEQATLALDRAIDEASPGAPVVLVGHSIGGLVATAEALHSPERVRALVLVETALAPQSTKAEADTFMAMLDRDWEGTLHMVYMSFGRDSLQGEQLWREASQVEREKMREWITVAMTADLTKEAAGLSMPVLAVLTTRSWEPEESWEHASHALGYANIAQLKGVRMMNSGHFVMLDEPRELAGAIRAFAPVTGGTRVAMVK